MFKPAFSDQAKQQWAAMPENHIKAALRNQIGEIIKGKDRGILITADSGNHYRVSTVLVDQTEYMIIWTEQGYNPTIILFIDLGTPRIYPGAYYSTQTKR